MAAVACIVLGFCLWPFVEYAVHGWLSHCTQSFVARMHRSHHEDPRRVYTPASAWIPAALLLFAALALPLGAVSAACLVVGLVAGFLRYERVHYNIHFRPARDAREARRIQHHLAHHLCDGRAYFGVTNRWTDQLFGTLPPNYLEDYRRVANSSGATSPT